eukprot:SAG11_NODE_3880_length_2171_cov_2.482625_4_plen_126_part_00
MGAPFDSLSMPSRSAYRVVDGKHRLHRLVAAGATAAEFYVLSTAQAAAALVLVPTVAIGNNRQQYQTHSGAVDVSRWLRANDPRAWRIATAGAGGTMPALAAAAADGLRQAGGDGADCEALLRRP